MSRKMRFLLAGVALVAIIAASWFLLISPLRSDIGDTNAAITEQAEKLAQAQAKLARAQTTRAEGQKNQARLMELAKMVPQSTQVPSLLVQIQDLADQSGVDFLSVSPGDPTEAVGFQIVPLTLSFSGSYFNLSDFSYRVEQLVAGPGRLLTVKSIQLTSNSGRSGTASTESDGESGAALGDSPVLGVSMTLYAFCMDQSSVGAPTASSTKSAGTSGSGTAVDTATTKN
jgi:type IV pilus assembly protein PilO